MCDHEGKVARAVRLLVWGLCLRCPRCGARALFRTWFSMHERCSVCQLRFEREQGYFLGAMYINYGVTVVLALIGSFALECWATVSLTQQLLLWVGFGSLFPVLFFRHSRGLWLAFDHIFDPVEDQGSGDGDDKGW
jgi:uncharacterized protein (DUF983 family)